MTITFSLNEDDIAAWQARTSPKSQARWWWLVVGAALATGLGLWHPPAFFFWLAVGALVLALQPSRSVAQEALGVRSIALEPDGLRVHSPCSRRLIFWEALQPLEETETHLFLPFTPQGVVIIPRRAFATPEAWADFRSELLRHHLWSLPQAA